MKQSNKMASPEFKRLGEMLLIKRGANGVRAVANEIGISAATLSRIERGHTADVATLKKVCDWLDVELSEVLTGSAVQQRATVTQTAARVHFRKNQTVAPETAQALAQLILAAQNKMAAQQ